MDEQNMTKNKRHWFDNNPKEKAQRKITRKTTPDLKGHNLITPYPVRKRSGMTCGAAPGRKYDVA